jgi:GAF domain-containing protein
MKRRSKDRAAPAKTRRLKAVKLKRRSPKRATPPADEKGAIGQLVRERDEALEQQAATSEVLQVIAASEGDLQPIFATMLEKAVSICGAKFGTLYLAEDGRLRLIAAQQVPEFIKARGAVAIEPAPGGAFHETMRTKRTVHVVDLAATKLYLEREPTAVAAVELGGVRSAMAVPILKYDKVIGIITIVRQEVRPFTDKQIALVTNFAAQAVIAIENARLLNELRQSLEQQTATADVLQVVSSSLGDPEPVFATMLEKAVRLCDATFGNIYRWDGEVLHLVATHNTPPAFAEARKQSLLSTSRIVASVLKTKTPVHIPDAAAQQGYIDRSDLAAVQSVELGGVRTFLAVPMLKEEELIGSFTVYRQEVRPFTEKQVELVKNFAAQAVIAIENARLLNQLRQRTGELTEALEQQTAASQVLRVISSFPGEPEPVFATALENAVRICDAKWGTINRWEGDNVHLMAMHNLPSAFAEARRRTPLYRPRANALFGRMAASKSVVHIADVATDEGYLERDPDHVAAVELGGARTVLAVPMLKENELIGAFAIVRQEVRPFSDKQIELVQNFAAQAVIAIENARLLNELRQRTTDLAEALEQQTAASDVLHAISSFPGDLEPVFATMLEKAVRICDASFGQLYDQSHRRWW